MKVSQFNKNGVITLGLETPQGLVDVPAEAARRGAQAPKTVLELIQGGEAARRQVEALAEGAACFAQGPAAPAVTGGSRILCIGLNYYRHAKECDMAVPPAPALFNKFANALAADGEAVALPEGYKEFDYEAELVVVMGKAARNVTAEEAPDYIFGYTCGNDLSTRDLQFARSNQWLLSKTFDGFAPLGPCVVTADSIDPADLAISSTVNGETRQDSRTSDLIF
ncbi:MAG: fumarylacetoacetate hydrolase family protein, partial [Oscillospiraceae bacterium]|nr:fumarylacetoacetate hydrolase family protein [Oscillospiraceae bacterium]